MREKYEQTELTYQELKDLLSSYGYEDAYVFDNPDFASAFVGVTDNGNAVYDYDLMVEYLINNEKMTIEEAEDYISYDTLRALGYNSGRMEKPPIVLFSLS